MSWEKNNVTANSMDPLMTCGFLLNTQQFIALRESKSINNDYHNE